MKQVYLKLLFFCSCIFLISVEVQSSNNNEGLTIRSDENIRAILVNVKKIAFVEYKARYEKLQNTSGGLTFSFTISQEGVVENLKLIESSINDRDFESYVLALVRDADFGAQKVKPRKITYKYKFKL